MANVRSSTLVNIVLRTLLYRRESLVHDDLVRGTAGDMARMKSLNLIYNEADRSIARSRMRELTSGVSTLTPTA